MCLSSVCERGNIFYGWHFLWIVFSITKCCIQCIPKAPFSKVLIVSGPETLFLFTVFTFKIEIFLKFKQKHQEMKQNGLVLSYTRAAMS